MCLLLVLTGNKLTIPRPPPAITNANAKELQTLIEQVLFGGLPEAERKLKPHQMQVNYKMIQTILKYLPDNAAVALHLKTGGHALLSNKDIKTPEFLIFLCQYHAGIHSATKTGTMVQAQPVQDEVYPDITDLLL